MFREFARVFTSWGPSTQTTKIAVDACRNRFAVVPVKPGGKLPLCTLTAREMKAAGEHHPCGTHHAITDPKVAKRVFDRLTKTGDVNIGVVAYPSRIVVVDVDTPDALNGFCSTWAQATEDEGYLRHSPTVRTPGTADQRHHGGGHYYFWLPEGTELEERPGLLTLPDGGDVRWGWYMTVVPPSSRPEGRYETLGEIQEIPAWLLSTIEERCAARTRASEDLLERYANDAIVRWACSVLWDELLTRHGWRFISKLDSCGCPIYEKPGGGTSGPKSATAHEPECDVMPNVEGHGALHLWTTDPPELLRVWCLEHGTQTLTKLQFVAAMEYDGDVTAAEIGLGLTPDPAALAAWLEGTADGADGADNPSVSATVSAVTRDDVPGGDDPLTGPDEPPRGADDERPAGDFQRLSDKFFVELAAREDARRRFNALRLRTEGDPLTSWVAPSDFRERYYASEAEPPPMVLVRTDGKGVFYDARVNGLVAKKGAGKTWVALDTSAQQMVGGRRVLYYDMEDQLRAWRQRLTLLGCPPDQYVDSGAAVWIKPGNIPDETDGIVEYAGSFDLVVFDVMNRLIVRRGGNPDAGNEQISWLFDNLFDPIAACGTAVLVLDHPNRRGQRSDASFDDMGPAGGMNKLNHASGHVVAMRVLRPFSRERIMKPEAAQRPFVQMVSLKDRSGYFEEGTVVAELRGDIDINDDQTIGLRMVLDPPAADSTLEEDLSADVDRVAENIRRKLIQVKPKGLKIGAIERSITESKRYLIEVALDRLKDRRHAVKDGDEVWHITEEGL